MAALRVIVTRPQEQAGPWVDALGALGVDAAALPLIDIAPVADAAPLRRAWQALAEVALVVFVSPNAVAHFLTARPPGTPWPAGTLAGSTGPGTSAALRREGVPDVAIVEPAPDVPSFDSEALWSQLALRDWAGRRVLVVRGEEGRDWLASTLGERGAHVDFVAAYRRAAPVPDAAGRALLAEAVALPQAHLWVFSSSEAVRHLQALAPAADWSHARAAASHPRIAEAARAAGFGRVDAVRPEPASVAALAQTAPIQSAPL